MADASTNSVPPKCAKCSKDKSDSGQGLKRCGRCKLAHYCSRECQKADWKNHKTLYGSAGDSPSPPSTLSPSTSTTPPQHLFSIDRPFHRLQSRTWPEHDVFVLLIDAYRLRMRDKFVFEWKVESDSVYAGAADAGRGFLRFLRLAEGENGLLPLWWSPAKSAECEALGMKAGWSSLARPITKMEVLSTTTNRYGNAHEDVCGAGI